MKCDPNGIKIAIFFQKLLENCPAAGCFAPRLPQPPAAGPGGSAPRPAVTRLSCTNLLTTSPNFDVLVKLFTLRIKSFSFSKSWLRAKSDPQLLIFYSLTHKKSLFSKISDDVIARDLRFSPPPIQNPDYAYALNHVQYAYQIPVVVF